MIRQLSITSSLLPLLACVSPLACTPELPSDEDEPPPLIDAHIETGYPSLTAPCRGPAIEPSHLVVTSTDFATGAVGLVDLETRTVQADLALASSDAVPIVDGGRVFIINRYGFDYIDELDPAADLALLHEWAIAATGLDTPSNPHGLALDPEGHAWVPLHGAPELQRFAFPTLQGAKVEAELALDLSNFADADAIPELSLALACGELLFVSIDATLTGLDGSLVVGGPKRAWVRLDGNVVGRLPLAEPLRTNPGPHVLVLSKPGHEPFSAEIEIERDSFRTIQTRLDVSNQRIASYFVLGIGTAAVIAGGVTLGFALEREARAEKLEQQRDDGQISTVDYQQYLDFVDQRNTLRTGAVISGIGGGVLVLAGLVLFFYESPGRIGGGEVARRWAPTFGPGRAGVVLRF
jgi:hypothetical protein